MMTTDEHAAEAVPDPRGALLQRPDVTREGGRSARGIVWNVAANGLGYVLRLGSIPILARLLSPDDYGLVAIVTAVTGLLSVIGAMGVTELVINRQKITHLQATMLFWASVLVGVVLTGVTIVGAPLVAAVFSREELTAITIGTAATFLINNLGTVHKALMMRRLQHRAVALRELVSLGAGLVAAVVAALLGAGYWALVIQMLVQSTVATVTALVAVPWRPGLPRRNTGARELVNYGSGASVFNIANYLGRTADNLVIGAFVNASALGLYTRAYGLLTAPLQQVHMPVGRVVTPTLAGLWPQPERYRRYFLTVLSGLCYVCMPVILVLAVLADAVVAVMLGDEWMQAADVFRWLAIVGFLQTVGWTNGWLYATSGQAWRWARWGLFSRSVLIVAFCVGVIWGIEGVAIAYAAVELVLTPLGIRRAGKGTPVSLPDVLRSVVRPAALAVVTALAALATSLLMAAGPVAELLVALGAAALAGAVLVLVWPAMRRELLGMARRVRDRS
jgi:O-antigen/teichoic acid export membrane protein